MRNTIDIKELVAVFFLNASKTHRQIKSQVIALFVKFTLSLYSLMTQENKKKVP